MTPSNLVVHLSDSGSGRAPLTVDTIVATVREFSTASLELIAWEFSVPTSEVEPLWTLAIDRGLIARRSRCWQTGELMFAAVDPPPARSG